MKTSKKTPITIASYSYQEVSSGFEVTATVVSLSYGKLANKQKEVMLERCLRELSLAS